MEQNITIPKKEIAPGIFTTGGVATMPTNVITPQSLAPQPQINLNTPEEFQNQPPTIDGDIAFFNQLQNQQTQAQQLLQAQQSGKNTEIENLMKTLGGQGQEQLSLEQQIVNPLQSQITDIMGQFGVKQAEYQNLLQQYEKAKTNIEAGAGAKGLTTSAVMGQQGAIDRAKASDLNVRASEMGILQAQALALQGKADLAQKQIDRAVDLKYKSVENELKIKQFQLDQIKENLTAEEKKKYDAQQYALKKEEARVAEQKATESAIQKMLLDATPNAPADIISNAKTIAEKGGSTLEVAQALGKYGGDYLKTELLKAQIQTEKAQASNYYASANKTKAETGLLGTDGGKPPTAAQATASGYASRVVQAKDIIDVNTDKLSKLSVASYLAQRKLPNYLQSPLVQQQLQAERNFVNAVLRRESGAAIADSEFASATKQYFPMPGDSAEVLAQKKLNRDLTSMNLINESGSAYKVNPVDAYFNFATGSLQNVNNQINNKEQSFLMSLPK
jgi:hypothetical protein